MSELIVPETRVRGRLSFEMDETERPSAAVASTRRRVPPTVVSTIAACLPCCSIRSVDDSLAALNGALAASRRISLATSSIGRRATRSRLPGCAPGHGHQTLSQCQEFAGAGADETAAPVTSTRGFLTNDGRR